MLDCLIIGGGIIGLAIADELVRAGRRVTLLNRPVMPDSGQRSSSMAAAGILPPPVRQASHDPLEEIRTFSDQIFPDWANRLHRDTDVDVGYQRCGGIHLASSLGESIALQVSLDDWRRNGVAADEISRDNLASMEPNIDFQGIVKAFRLPGEQQVRPASLVTALTRRLQQNGVDLRQNSGVLQLRLQNGLAEARAGDQSVAAREVIVAAGPWSTDLLQPLGFDIGVEPFRGQMAMWQLDSQAIAHVINEGPRYVLCRPDGELIVGSTVEEVGFDCRTTDEGIAALVEFAQRLIPRLRGRPPDTTWAGLRPHSRDGVPSIGRVAAIDNLTVATGHFRSGIHLAPATALLVRQVLCNEPIAINIAPFAPRRN